MTSTMTMMTSKIDNLRAKLARWLCPEVFTERENLRSQYLRTLSQLDKAKTGFAGSSVRANAEKQALEAEVTTLIADKTRLEEQLRDLTKKVEKYKRFKVLYYNLRRQLEEKAKR